MKHSLLLIATSLLAGFSIGPAASAASVIVNEINAGGASMPGDWFEVVVVGSGTAGSTVDLRGWSFRVDNNGTINVGYFTLSNSSYWGAVPAGTILTFHEDNTAGGGMDTAINVTNNLTTLGWAHTNIYVGDSTYINTSAIGYDGSFPIDQNNSQVAIFDAASSLVFGPAGEGHAGYTGGGVSASEIFKLEANPSPFITLASPYNDGSTSTFGAPNRWDSDTLIQDFSAFAIPEPSALGLAALGAFGLIRRRR